MGISLKTNLPMKTKHQTNKCTRVLNGREAKSPSPDCSVLVAIGAVIALMLLSGCSSTPVGGESDAWQYNSVTGYPAVGGSSPDW